MSTTHSLGTMTDGTHKTGEQFGDAIWLGNMRATDILTIFCFSTDLERAVYRRVPVGLSADSEVEMAQKQEIFRITGLHPNPSPLENHLCDSSAEWEAYRHSTGLCKCT